MTIAELAAKYEQYVIDMRREFHENPELSHHEERTVRRIREELDKLGIPNITVGHNNVIGTLEGGKPGKKIAIRADIDALPVAEANEVPYKSKVEGVMHACGHDGHAAMLLGTAHVLSEIRDQLCGTVYLCFQVAEEIAARARMRSLPTSRASAAWIRPSAPIWRAAIPQASSTCPTAP